MQKLLWELLAVTLFWARGARDSAAHQWSTQSDLIKCMQLFLFYFFLVGPWIHIASVSHILHLFMCCSVRIIELFYMQHFELPLTGNFVHEWTKKGILRSKITIGVVLLKIPFFLKENNTYINVCMYIYIYVCISIYTCMYIYICVCIYIYTCVYVYIHICVYVCVHICMYVNIW